MTTFTRQALAEEGWNKGVIKVKDYLCSHLVHSVEIIPSEAFFSKFYCLSQNPQNQKLRGVLTKQVSMVLYEGFAKAKELNSTVDLMWVKQKGACVANY